MRIPVKGIHWTLAKLADGTQKIYWYAWKNGPRSSWRVWFAGIHRQLQCGRCATRSHSRGQVAKA